MVLLALFACIDRAAPRTAPDDHRRPPAADDSATRETGGDAVEATLTAGATVTCADPGARETLGAFEILDGGTQWQNQRVTSEFDGWGAAVADYDGDGNPDIFLPHAGPDQIYMGRGDGTWREEDRERLTADPDDFGDGAIAVDYDGDADLDIWVSNTGPNALYRNDDGVFTSVGVAAGLSGQNWESQDGAWGDMDGDGDLDLFVANYYMEDRAEGQPDANELYENNGDGTFTDVSSRLQGFAARGYTHATGWHDLDLDGDLDLIVVNDKPSGGYTTVVRLQVDGQLVDDGGVLGLNVSIEGMGVGVGDLNGDLFPDLAISGWGQLALMESTESGRWVNATQSVGLVLPADGPRIVAWGMELADLDNDADLDLYAAFGEQLNIYGVQTEGEKNNNPAEQSDGLWVNDGGQFTEASSEWGVDALGIHRGVAFTDLNRDGWLDLVERDLRGRARILAGRCSDAAWVGFQLREGAPNPFAVGARVEVTAGGITQVRTVSAGSTNLASSGAPEVQFGLGGMEVIDRVRVWWPDGAMSALRDVPVREWATVTRE